jgi:N-acetylglucosamine-6-phosphate deacetylase
MGSLDPGKYADVVVMKEDFTVLYTIIGGKTVYAA